MNDRELEAAVVRKVGESRAAAEEFFAKRGAEVVAMARAMASAFDNGARLFVMGNGGSACDALHMAVEFSHPIVEKRPALPATALCADPIMITAIGNDLDFSMVFARQIEREGRAGDIAVGISTSGQSANVLRGLRAARDAGMLTIGLAGRDGGRMVDACDHILIVPSFSIHRIQETHEQLLHILWDLIHVIRGEEDVL